MEFDFQTDTVLFIVVFSYSVVTALQLVVGRWFLSVVCSRQTN